ncbi:MAG: hypothetical protein ABI559_01240 [Chloroflexota bacterium]
MTTNVSGETPENVARIAEVMSAFPSDWILCGGWAVDAWLGRVTREHGDLDIAVFEDAGAALFKHMAGWQMVAHDGELADTDTNKLWDGRKLSQPAHLHCRAPEDNAPIPEGGALLAEDGFGLEIVVNPREHGEWVLRDSPRVTVALDRFVAESPWGLPTAVPEVLLFFKATAYKGTRHYLRPRDHVDFERMVPTLTPEQKAWLTETIARVEPDHPWLGVLAM